MLMCQLDAIIHVLVLSAKCFITISPNRAEPVCLEGELLPLKLFSARDRQ